MHPEIAHFPNQQFYGGDILNRANLTIDRFAPWHGVRALGAYRLFDHNHPEQAADNGRGYINHGEAELAIELYRALSMLWERWSSQAK